MDAFDIDWESLSFGELLVLQDQLEGELKRRNFPGSATSAVPHEKRIVAIALELRLASQILRGVAREFKAPKGKKGDAASSHEALVRLREAVRDSGANIGHEGSHLLEVMSEARRLIEKGTTS